MKTMRPQHVVLPLALLSAAFMLSCSETSDPAGPNADAPVPNFAHNQKAPTDHGGGGETEDATFDVEFFGDVFGGGVLLGPNGGKNNLQNEFGNLVTINLTDLSVGNHDFCFGTGSILSIMQVSQVTPGDINNAVIRFFFDAKGTEGAVDVNYGLMVFGTFGVAQPWPPTTNNPNTITGNTFTLAHNNGPGKKVACTGAGTLSFQLLVELAS